jgi:hypothetical protein
MRLLLGALKKASEELKRVMQTKHGELMPELMEEEFNQFNFHAVLESIIDKASELLRNPLFMLPSIDPNQINRRVPSQLTFPRKPVDLLRSKIKVFLAIRYAANLLTGLQGQNRQSGSESNPISREQTPIHSWQQGSSYLLPSVNVELILCNERKNKQMCVRYVMIDPEFFILIEPDFSVSNQMRIVIH